MSTSIVLQKVKHSATIRERRYPWKTREESKHSQTPSAGGEGRCCIIFVSVLFY